MTALFSWEFQVQPSRRRAGCNKFKGAMRAMYGNTGLHKFEASLGYIFPICKQIKKITVKQNKWNKTSNKQTKQHKEAHKQTKAPDQLQWWHCFPEEVTEPWPVYAGQRTISPSRRALSYFCHCTHQASWPAQEHLGILMSPTPIIS